MNIIKSSALKGSSRCAKRRSFAFTTSSEVTNNMSQAYAVKDVLLNALYEKHTSAQVYDELLKKFDELKFPTDQTRLEQVDIARKCVVRYIKSENRTPIPATMVTKMTLSFDELSTPVEVSPDAIFFTKSKATGVKTLEIVKYKTGKPDLAYKSKKLDNSVEQSLELYAMFCYGRQFAMQILKDGEQCEVKASYYFLKKKNDSFGKTPHFDLEFFDNAGGNVCSLVGNVENAGGGTYFECDLDKNFKPLLERYDIGETECTPDMCANCDLDAICNYKYSPSYIEKERKTTSLRSLSLTKAQQEVIDFRKGVARCNAGAGAGKTLVVALRVVNLLLDGVKPEEILLLTFTNAGADEMTQRVKAYIEDYGIDEDIDCDKLVSTTFNSFCNDIVMNEYKELGFTNPPRVINDVERASIIAKIADSKKIDGLDYRNFDNLDVVTCGINVVKKAFDIIKTYKLSIGDEELLKEKLQNSNMMFVSLTGLTQLIDAYNVYDMHLKANNLIEFSDQELLTFDLLKINPYYLEQFGFKHIIVDEFQDSSARQLDLIKELKDCPAFESLMVVGDDSQSIFSFRDTTPEYIINFFKEMGIDEEDQKDFFLVENHRSIPEVIELANKTNMRNKNRVKKDLIATRPSGKAVTIKGFHKSDEETELDWVVAQIKERIARGEDNAIGTL